MLIISLSKVNDNLNNQQISERPTYVLINNFTHLIVSKRMGRSLCCETVHTNKGSWTKEEDQKLVAYIRVHGEGCWRSLPKAAGLLRCGKSCRLRWINYLRPDLKRGNFSVDEIEIIIKLHNLFGNKYVRAWITSYIYIIFNFLSIYMYIHNIYIQMVFDCREIAGKDRQRDQELLEHTHQEEAIE